MTRALFAGGAAVIGVAVFMANGIPWALAYVGSLAVLVAVWRGI